MKVFLDACIIFDAIENGKMEGLLRKVTNLNHELWTSITVLGEVVHNSIQEKKEHVLPRVPSLLSGFDIGCYYPCDLLRQCCYCIDVGGVFDRASITDRTHLAYASSYRCDYFLTTDHKIKDYPDVICKASQTQPIGPRRLRNEL